MSMTAPIRPLPPSTITMTSPTSARPNAAGPRQAIAEVDRHRYERNPGEILVALGLDLESPGTHDTPRRRLAALVDATDGYDGDPVRGDLDPNHPAFRDAAFLRFRFSKEAS